MEISFLNKNKNVQMQKVHDLASDPAKKLSAEENDKFASKNPVDTAEISASHSGKFEDKNLMIAKSSILYEVSVATDSDAVQELKEKIDNGTYNVPSDLLADAILK